MVAMEMGKVMTKNMDKANRIHRSTTARVKRKKTKETIRERTMNLFSKLRRMRKNK